MRILVVIIGFNNLVIDKTGGTLAVDRTTPNTTVVAGYFSLLNGTFNDGGNTFNISGNVTNSGIHTGSGLIALTGTNAQTIAGDGNGVFQNLRLNNTSGAAGSAAVSLTAGITVTGILNLANNRLFNIGSYPLILTSTGSITGTFSANRFIATNGDIGDRGITKTFSSNSFVFPIGVIPTNVRYTPVTVTLSSTPTTYGSITVFPVDAEQMQTSPNGRNRSLTYFWRVRSSGFVLGPANVSQTFTYAQSDVVTGNPQIDENSYVPARYDPSTFAWNKGTAGDVDETNNIINWPNNVPYINGDYTAGDNTPQDPFSTVQVYYSYQTGNWWTQTTWVTDTVTNNNAGTRPDINSPAIIRNGHTVSIDNNNRASGNLQIQSTGVLDCGAFTGLNFGIVTNPINGSGKIRISSNTFPSGDFTEFRSSSGGTVEYYTPAGSSFTIPTVSASSEALNYYRHLILTPATGRNITMPNLNLTLYGNLLVQGASATGVAQINTAAARTLSVDGNLTVASGNLQFRTGTSQSITVGGDIAVANGAIFDVLGGGTTTNSITLTGNLMNNGTVGFNNGNSCDITFTGAANTSFTGTGNTTLRNLTLNKGTSQTSTLTVDVSGSTFSTPANNWLTLTNGTFRFMRAGNLNITTTSTFTIPATAGLYVNNSAAVVNIANSNANNNDLYLNGKLTLIDGNLFIGPAAAPNFNNDIEYSGSGDSEIDIRGGNLTVNGQIRRSSIVTGGVLVYRQSGGNVIINGNNALTSRAKFEVDNSGSVFEMSGGTMTIIRGGGTTFGDLYIRPASGAVTGGTMLLGTQNVGAVQTIRFDSNIPLNNLTLNGVGTNNTFQLTVNPLELNGNLLISSSNSIFNANDLDVSVMGDFTNNGTYTPGTNVTTLNGLIQQLNGSTSTQFYDLVINPFTSVSLANDITVNHDLSLLRGTFSTSAHNVHIKGNLTNNATHTGDINAGGLLLNGASLQLIAGSGTFGRLELNNPSGARMENNINLQQDFLLTNGILNINQYLLTLGTNSDIVGSGFGITKMIKPDGVFSNIGIRKYFNAGSPIFTFPLGVTGKYTPAILTAENMPAGGVIRINVINERHPTVTDPNNVLQYYWEVASVNLPDFEGILKFKYSNGDVMGNESNYVASRLIVPPGIDWSKAASGPPTDNVDENSDTIYFNFPAGTTSLGGEYTAGTDAAIPSEVPVFTSNGDGNWDNENIWTPVSPAGGPNGFIVVIREGDVIAANGNRRFAYHTTLNGTLNVGTTYGHNLGTIDGSGTLYMEGPILPAGRFDDFFSCSGGTLVFGGNGDYTIIADRIDTLHNLFFTGSGDRIMPDKDIVICDTLKIDGPDVKNDVHNRKITLLGTVQRLNSGTFKSGTGPHATLVFAGSSAQTLGGSNGNFTGSNALNNLEIDNLHGLTLQGPLELNGDLRLTDGIIYSTALNKLSMLNGNAIVTPAGGSAASFVSGPVSKRIFGGNDFVFPTGKATRYGVTTLIGVSDGTWEGEYFNSGYAVSAVTAPLTTISATEYWHVKGPAGKQAYVRLRWDPLSDVTPLTTQNGIGDIRVAEYNTGTSRWIEKSTFATGNDYNGTAETTGKMNLDERDYTLASVSSLKPRANFTTSGAICSGDILQVAFTNTAASYSFTYTINGGANQVVNTTANPYTVATLTAGRYRLTGFTGGVVDTNSVWVNALPTATLTSNDADNQVCEGTTVVFTAGGGLHYQFYVNSIFVQAGATPVYSTTTLSNGDVVYAVATNAAGCADTSQLLTMIVLPLPVPGLAGNPITCTGAIETYTTEIGMNSYDWTVTGGTVSSGGSGTDNTITIVWNSIGAQTVQVNYINATGCSAVFPTEFPVEVFKRPETGPAHVVPNDFSE